MSKFKVEDVNLLEDAAGEKAEDPKIRQFSVQKPVKVGGHIRYTITGVDQEGPFEESRRFKEFYALRTVLA